METGKIGLQLYSVRDECSRDLPGTLSAAAGMGYEGVEFAGFFNYSAAELKKMLDERGLECCGSHTHIEDLLGEKLSETVEFNRTLDNRFLVVPGLPAEFTGSIDGWKKAASVLNGIADELGSGSLILGYHNHSAEFEPVEGRLPWEVLMESTHPEIFMQLDTGNALKSGGDPEYYLEKYPERAVTIHLKEYSVRNEKAVIGEGDVNWTGILESARKAGTRWLIVEQKSPAHPPLECVRICLRNLKSMLTRP